jgi:acetylornithine aminotransferase
MEKAFFTNSGSEANETAIKLVRLYGNSLDIKEPTILVFDKAFHGWSLATLTASAFPHVQSGFEPLTCGFLRCPFGDEKALEKASSHPNIVAVFLEPIQGSGGIHIASQDFLTKIRQLCNEKKWLMITDEIQTGMGRTGQFLSLQHFGLLADIVTLSKGLANGIPIGACLTQGKANDLFAPGKHGSTMGGNPLACSMALKTLEIQDKLNTTLNAKIQGELLINLLQKQLSMHPLVKEIRGKGLMIGIELKKPCKEMIHCALKTGLLINVVQQKIIRLLPPLIIQKEEVEQICQKLTEALEIFHHS